jgi:LmbE family N-acetylglucosaminyl deacetylase
MDMSPFLRWVLLARLPARVKPDFTSVHAGLSDNLPPSTLRLSASVVKCKSASLLYFTHFLWFFPVFTGFWRIFYFEVRLKGVGRARGGFPKWAGASGFGPRGGEGDGDAGMALKFGAGSAERKGEAEISRGVGTMQMMRKALVIGAHPDDCQLGAAGFAALLRRAGWQVTFLTMTDGELGGDPRQRIEEERLSAKLLGVGMDLCHLPDGAMTGPETVKVLEAKLVEHAPDLILTHAPDDSHGDHRVLSESLVSAARRHDSVLFFEGPSSLAFAGSLRIDISSVWEQKVRSLLAHGSQRERVRTVEWAETVARHRAWPHYRGLCEAFVPVRMNMNLVLQAMAGMQLPGMSQERGTTERANWSVA